MPVEEKTPRNLRLYREWKRQHKKPLYSRKGYARLAAEFGIKKYTVRDIIKRYEKAGVGKTR